MFDTYNNACYNAYLDKKKEKEKTEIIKKDIRAMESISGGLALSLSETEF